MMDSRNERIYNIILSYVTNVSVFSVMHAWKKCVETELGLLLFYLLFYRNKYFGLLILGGEHRFKAEEVIWIKG